MRIAIADDHPVVQLGLAHLIEDRGWDVCALASDGREAVACVREAKPDLLVMEYALPGLNGVQAVREIARSATGTETLLIAGPHSPHALAQIFRSPARGALLKREAVEELLPALETILRHHTFRSRGLTELYQEIQAMQGAIEPLTAREHEVLELVAGGFLSKEIADRFGVSLKTVEHHRNKLKQKLRARSVAELVYQAIRFGLVPAG